MPKHKKAGKKGKAGKGGKGKQPVGAVEAELESTFYSFAVVVSCRGDSELAPLMGAKRATRLLMSGPTPNCYESSSSSAFTNLHVYIALSAPHKMHKPARSRPTSMCDPFT